MYHQKQAKLEPWRPYEFVLSPGDLSSVRYIEQVKQLQDGVAIMNIELRRLFNNDR
jgi:hypothetical protein